MDLLDFWIFSHAFNKIINQVCRLICSVIFVDNKSFDYKTQGFGLLIKSCYSLFYEYELFVIIQFDIHYDLS